MRTMSTTTSPAPSTSRKSADRETLRVELFAVLASTLAQPFFGKVQQDVHGARADALEAARVESGHHPHRNIRNAR